MTGKEFEAGMSRLGMTQADLSRVLGVHRNTIGARCLDAEVPPLYRAAMIGLLAEKAAGLLVSAVEHADETTRNTSNNSTQSR